MEWFKNNCLTVNLVEFFLENRMSFVIFYIISCSIFKYNIEYILRTIQVQLLIDIQTTKSYKKHCRYYFFKKRFSNKINT